MSFILYLIIGILLGAITGWFVATAKVSAANREIQGIAQQKLHQSEQELVVQQATSSAQYRALQDILTVQQKEHKALQETAAIHAKDLLEVNNQWYVAQAQLLATRQTIVEKDNGIQQLQEEMRQLKGEWAQCNQLLATATANNNALKDKLQQQYKDMDELGKKFNMEFEHIANKILDTKTEKFTELNKNNLKTILEPLGKNIDEFKKQVDEVYKTESKERFSLGEKVKELAQLNQIISEEARNLTKALKGEAKTQGRWGEMILESILEKSGLVKNREYFMEHELLDASGNSMRSDAEGKKMRPDAVIKYPDNRSVIIDSKVSLNAFTRLLAATDVEEQTKELTAHVAAIKNHIIALSAKGYDDYDKALDFVMLFVPSEPAYIAALQGDADLWNFAYDRRILLLSPTNLITSLKLIADLWKREYQNQNAQEIAERGAKLYDKFVGFVANLQGIGTQLDRAQSSYEDAYKQLTTGNDNLVLQATKLKDLGLKTKKELSAEISNILLDTDTQTLVNLGGQTI
jgi:DNA recombination protein RmuC